MAGVLNSVKAWLPGPRMVIALAVLAAFAALATAIYFIFNKKAGPKFVPNAEFYDKDGAGGAGGGAGSIKVTMFGVPWCPHSKASMKPWNEWKAANDGQTVSGAQVECETVNCEADEASEAKCSEAGVKGYPTVIAETPGGAKVVMDAKTTVAALNQFVAKVASGNLG
jgi:glutaredoxin